MAHCLGQTAIKNGVAVVADTASVALTVFAPEAKVAQIVAAGTGIAASAAAGDLPALGNGIGGYHLMMADWAAIKGWVGGAVRFAGKLSGVGALINDAYHTYDDYQKCRAGEE